MTKSNQTKQFQSTQAVSASISTHALPQEGFVRLSQILKPTGPIPVSKSTWWNGVADGRFPQPHYLGERTTAWDVADIRILIEQMKNGEFFTRKSSTS